MKHDYFVRITRSYSDLSGMVAIWSERASKVVVYEHTGEQTEKTHIHMVIIGSSVCKKQLKNLVGYLNLKGNEDWSFKDYDGNETAMTYMTKGTLDPKYIKGYTAQDAETWKSLWRPGRRNMRVADIEELWNSCFGNREQAEIDRELYFKQYPDRPLFDWVLHYAREAAFSWNKAFWTIKAKNDYKCLVHTYVYRYSVSIPIDKRYDSWRSLV